MAVKTAIKGAGRCPKCASRKVVTSEQQVTEFYSRTIQVCVNCQSAWEPIDMALIWDPDDPLCSFSEPCDNCAFRPGSHEQQDPKKWADLMRQLKDGSGMFFCHKGVPIDFKQDHESDSGFQYPYKNGKPDTRKLRRCRGYLNMLFTRIDKATANTRKDQ